MGFGKTRKKERVLPLRRTWRVYLHVLGMATIALGTQLLHLLLEFIPILGLPGLEGRHRRCHDLSVEVIEIFPNRRRGRGRARRTVGRRLGLRREKMRKSREQA